MDEKALRHKILEAKAAQLAAEARKAEAEAKRAEADATETLINIRFNEINLHDRERKEAEDLADNRYHHVYFFADQVNESSVSRCVDRLTEWHRLSPDCEIEIIFNSPGGSVIPGMALFDYIRLLRRQGHKVTTVALGYAASMAGILLQAGDHRVIGQEAYVLIHEISAGAVGKIGEIEDEVKFIKKIQGRVLDIFAERSTKKREYFARHWRRKDWWLDSAECKKLGIVDEVR